MTMVCPFYFPNMCFLNAAVELGEGSPVAWAFAEGMRCLSMYPDVSQGPRLPQREGSCSPLPVLHQGREVKMLRFPLCCLTLSMSSGTTMGMTSGCHAPQLNGSGFLSGEGSLLHRVGAPRLLETQGGEWLRVMWTPGSALHPQAVGSLGAERIVCGTTWKDQRPPASALCTCHVLLDRSAPPCRRLLGRWPGCSPHRGNSVSPGTPEGRGVGR